MGKIHENPVKMDDLGLPLFMETLISGNPQLGQTFKESVGT